MITFKYRNITVTNIRCFVYFSMCEFWPMSRSCALIFLKYAFLINYVDEFSATRAELAPHRREVNINSVTPNYGEFATSVSFWIYSKRY